MAGRAAKAAKSTESCIVKIGLWTFAWCKSRWKYDVCWKMLHLLTRLIYTNCQDLEKA